MKKKVMYSWSGGKDSALGLYEMQQSGDYDIDVLLTTVTKDYNRISMHGVRNELLDAQSEALGIPVKRVEIPAAASNELYQTQFTKALRAQKENGISVIAFADLYLEDIRSYRETMLEGLDIEPVFPVWLRDTREFYRSFLRLGFKSVVVCVDTKQLDASFAGRELDDQFLADLPEGVDPCGENGEYHSFVYDAPNYKQPIGIERGEKVMREQFCFCDLLSRV